MKTYLGIDLGTSGLRALLVAENGTVIGAAQAAYPVENPHSGWSEQDPADWIAACKTAIAELHQTHPEQMARLAAIGTAGQMHGATLLDDAGDVLRPCILWNDTRSSAEAAKLDALPDFHALSGNIVFPGFTAPKLLWVKNNEPDIFARVATVLLPKDYLSFWLTGARVSDMSDSAGTSWLDVGARDWSAALLEQSGMAQDQMPRLVEGSEVAAPVSTARCAELGLPDGVVVVGGAGDNAAAACGIGALDEGQGFVSLGTSGVLLAGKSGYAPLPASAVHTFCHAVPNRWYQMGVILSATDSLNWLARTLKTRAGELAGLLDGPLNAPGSVTFLPYLSGERTPHNDSAIRGALLGLDHATGDRELVQAVFEGVAFALRENLDALHSTGTELSSIMAIGGGSRSNYWLELIATVLDLPLDLPEDGENGAAMGAARLAICGATGAAPETVMTPPRINRRISPNSDLTKAYAQAYQAYRAVYPAIKAL
ncbi:xylulokinase [Neptunicoccus cionae]|uniref:Xylulose kinase n=1 Tax=Neptunicoccus cionae TaxID=2035344 RepID=A0A916R216_9RHOB|nr:xylulokinase [Amylibacter cionae]GGA27831.1 xylulokinase [Amylibacter cionae]